MLRPYRLMLTLGGAIPLAGGVAKKSLPWGQGLWGANKEFGIYLCITEGDRLALSYWLSTPSITLMI